ncbi:MAG: TIGR03905 family TSCPD domain-containing protein [Clostridia bacterium]|jgi:uncharacterized protein (TIGR03905 family)|nr:TIGR03905 family TSCPD domain-containing protein [Clostridia bacterium]MCX4366912.1 TIGR03905 family TSCPD domain-containing protein [Clostridia bacterium]
MRFRYKPRGICAREINVSVEDDCITDVEFVGGCIGNHRGIRKLCLGRNIDEIISLLEGVECRGNTSCPDQLAKALLYYKSELKDRE